MKQNINRLSVRETPITGLLVVDLPLHGDERGWFKEHWQREKMVALGLPDFHPVQQNVSFNAEVGTTRGIHAEPWDKYVSIANGRAFGTWVDLREGPGFGEVFTTEISPKTAVFVPRGVANAFQTLTPNVSYMYLVNAHWSPDAEYSFVNLADPTLDIPWPIPLEEAVVSAKDLRHPYLNSVIPVQGRQTVVLGSNGQLGRALRQVLGSSKVDYLSREHFDLSNPTVLSTYDWTNVETIINAAAFTSVDLAETTQGRVSAWQINAKAVATLVEICNQHNITLVNFSSDYVFDGTSYLHTEDEPLSPLGVYGQTKAAGDLAVEHAEKHYTVRTSWVVGDGKNFVRTIAKIASSGGDPKVIDDQFGRLSFAQDLARGVKHLLSTRPAYGTYNLSNSGESSSWYEVALHVFEYCGYDPKRVQPISSLEFLQSKLVDAGPVSPRPHQSMLSLEKIIQTGFHTIDWKERLKLYCAEHL